MKLAFAALVLRLPSNVPEELSYNWYSISGEQYVSAPEATWGFGLGGQVGVFQTGSGAVTIGLSADLRRRSYVTDYPMDFYGVNAPVDIGYRFDTCSMGADDVACFWFGGAIGPRFSYLMVPGWSDLLTVSWGLDTGIGLTLGTGSVRANLGVNIGFDVPGGGISGSATFPDSSVDWSYTDGGITAAAMAGVELR